MKFNSIIFSSLVALAVAVQGKEAEIAEEKVIVKPTVVKPITETLIPITVRPTVLPTILPTIAPIRDCLIGQGEVVPQYLECTKQNGRFYKKFHPYPECYSDFVCFLPAEENQSVRNCIVIDEKVYCSATISNIKTCQPTSDEYNFKACVREAAERFSDLTYKFISGPTIMPPPPTLRTTILPTVKPTLTLTKTRITLPPITHKPTIITRTRITTLKPTLTKTRLTLTPITVKPTLTKTRLTLTPITVKPTIITRTLTKTIKPTILPTINPTILPTVKPTVKPTIIKPTVNPTIIKPTIIRPTVGPVIMKEEDKLAKDN